MPSKLRSSLTYANVMATVAVFIALGGSSYAAIQITGNSVTNGSLTGRDVKNDSLTGKDIKRIGTNEIARGSLRRDDFRKGDLPAGPQGPKGDPGEPATRLWAVVNSDGTLRRGSGVVSTAAQGSAANPYIVVEFNRDVSNCAHIASHAQDTDNHSQTGEIAADSMRTPVVEPDSVVVQSFESGGYDPATAPPVNKDFQLAVLC